MKTIVLTQQEIWDATRPNTNPSASTKCQALLVLSKLFEIVVLIMCYLYL